MAGRSQGVEWRGGPLRGRTGSKTDRGRPLGAPVVEVWSVPFQNPYLIGFQVAAVTIGTGWIRGEGRVEEHENGFGILSWPRKRETQWP
jgi:hypothetical protein